MTTSVIQLPQTLPRIQTAFVPDNWKQFSDDGVNTFFNKVFDNISEQFN